MIDVMRENQRELTNRERNGVEETKIRANILVDIWGRFPQNREMSIAKQKLEEAVMWAVKGITA